MLLRPTSRLLSRQSCFPAWLLSLPANRTSQCPYPPQFNLTSRSHPQQQRRHFILPTPPAQTFSATRRIAYPPPELFKLISDVNSYSKFVPFCLSSVVTETSSPPENYPVRANLRVGWGGFDETFTSRLKCSTRDDKNGGNELSGGIVEADATENSIFEVLRARWTIDGAKDPGRLPSRVVTEGKESQVDLEIEYKFSNPLYAALSEAVMPTVAGKMIEAFEARAEVVLGKPGKE